MIENWPPDTVARPEKIYRGLCYFSWINDYEKATKYQEAEVPFLVRDHPDLEATVYRWKDDDYVNEFLGGKKFMTEVRTVVFMLSSRFHYEETTLTLTLTHNTQYSADNHFMYWRHIKKKDKVEEGWKPPTEMLNMKFKEWLKHASAGGRTGSQIDRSEPHWYFRVSACSKADKCPEPNTPELYDELPWFDVDKRTLLMVRPEVSPPSPQTLQPPLSLP